MGAGEEATGRLSLTSLWSTLRTWLSLEMTTVVLGGMLRA